MSNEPVDTPTRRPSARPTEALVADDDVQSLVAPCRTILDELKQGRSARSDAARMERLFRLARLVHQLSILKPPILSGTTFAAALPGKIAAGGTPDEDELKVVDRWLTSVEHLLAGTTRRDLCHAQNCLVLAAAT